MTHRSYEQSDVPVPSLRWTCPECGITSAPNLPHPGAHVTTCSRALKALPPKARSQSVPGRVTFTVLEKG